jgi:hypothetical protein
MSMRRFTGIAMLCVVLAGMGLAQEYRASISGTVKDPSGSAVLGAKVVVTDVLKNTSTELVTNTVGFYSVPFLLPSRYKVTVEMSGFKKFSRQDIVLGVNDKLGLDVDLEVGAMAESVTVTGQLAVLQTETASRGGAVEQRLVEDMPNNGRNMFQVVFAMPGVYKPSFSQGNSFDIGSGIGNANPQVNGSSQGTNGRAWNTEMLVDGMADNRSSKEIVNVPALETVQEIQVLTSMYDAAYGHTGGGVVSILTKSGTNTFHGAVFDRVTDNKWRANTWVENYLARTKSISRLHNYGFQVNGPVAIPKLFNGKDKLFFMLSWDKSPRDAKYFQYSMVPSVAMKNRNFSGLVGAGGQPVLIYDPLTTRLDSSGKYLRTPFTGNVIPIDRVDPVAAKILSYYPDPNVTGGGVTGLERNFLNEGTQHDMTAQWAGRLDLRLSEKHSFFGRFTVTDQHRDGSYQLGANSPADNQRDKRADMGRQASFDWTAMLNPSTIWTLRAGFARFEELAGSDRSKSFDPAQLGWPSSLVSQFAGKHFPNVNLGSYTILGADTIENLNASNTYTVQPSVGKVYHSHVMKMGAEIRDYQMNQLTMGLPSGSFSFARSWTQANALTADAYSGDEIATALLGYASGQFAIPIAPAYRYKYWVLFFQDDWKVSKKLSLNLGLRWDYESPPTERYNRMLRGYAFDQPSPIASQVKAAAGVENCPACTNLMGGPLFAAVNGLPRTAFDPDRNNFQPRVGVAYSLNPKTVFRGGYALYYTALSVSEAGGNTGFSRTTPIITSPDGLTPNVRISDPLAGGSLLRPIGSSQGLSTNLGLGMGLNYLPRGLPKSHMVSAGFQRELPFAMTVDASYVANISNQLPVGIGLNFIPASQLGQASSYYSAQVTNPFKGLLPNNSSMNGATITRSSLMYAYPHFPLSLSNVPIGKNRFDSMQLQLRRRFGSGFTIQVNYMISKTLEQLQLLNAQDVNLTDYSKSILDKRLTPFDIPQRLAVIGVYDLPVGKGRKYASGMPYPVNLFLGGWTLGWNITHQSGFPIDFPNAAPLSATSAKLGSDQRGVYKWFDTSLFPKVAGPAPFTLRNFSSRFPNVRFMDLDTWDLNLSKDFPIRERLKGQIRVNAINAFNHPYLTSMASLNVTASNFGQLAISQGNVPRNISFDFRLLF